MRRFTNEPLYVVPALVGLRVASPARRLLAFAADAIVIVVPTIAVAVGAALLTLQLSDPRAARAIPTLLALAFQSEPKPLSQTPAEQQRIARLKEERTRRAEQAFQDLIPLMARTEARGLPESVKELVAKGEVDRAANEMKGYKVVFLLDLSAEPGERSVPPRTVMFEIGKVIPGGIRAVALLGVPALYFAFFARSRRGATIGKWLFGIRVVRLDGERLSWLESIERFVGYVHSPGTFFVSLLDLWRDPNRRLPHDRVVHTAVLRMPRRAAAPVHDGVERV